MKINTQTDPPSWHRDGGSLNIGYIQQILKVKIGSEARKLTGNPQIGQHIAFIGKTFLESACRRQGKFALVKIQLGC